jgi:hypothetical protein
VFNRKLSALGYLVKEREKKSEMVMRDLRVCKKMSICEKEFLTFCIFKSFKCKSKVQKRIVDFDLSESALCSLK